MPARSLLRVTPAGYSSHATISAAGTESPPEGALLEVESSDAGWDAAIARTVAQKSGFDIYVGGILVDLSEFVGTVSVTRSYDQRLQTWTFEVALDSPNGVFGSPFSCIGPPIGRREVDVYGVYVLLDGSKISIPLIQDGTVDNSVRSASGEGRFTESFRGVCRGGRFDHVPVTLNLPPGHGLPRGRVMALLAEQAGETNLSIEPGNETNKEVQIVDGDWLGLSQEQQEVENRRVLWDTWAFLTNPKIGMVRVDEVDGFLFEEQDFLSISEVTLEHTAAVITEITLTGNEQVTGEVCGDVAQTKDVIERAVYSPYAPAYYFDGADWIANPQSSPTALDRMIRLIRQTVVTRCGVVVYERTDKWEWRNPLVTRRYWNEATEEWLTVGSGPVYSDDGADDSDAASFRLPIEQFMPIECSETWHYYHQVGYVPSVPVLTAMGRSLFANYPGLISTTTGKYIGNFSDFYLGSMTATSAILFVRAAIRERDTSVSQPWDSFDDINPIDQIQTIGSDAVSLSPSLPSGAHPGVPSDLSGFIVSPRGEDLRPVSLSFRSIYADADGYTTKEVTEVDGWSLREVGQGSYLYGDGRQSEDEAETWIRGHSRSVTDYIPVQGQEATHTRLESQYAHGGFVSSQEHRGQSGLGPPVAQLPKDEVNADAYEGEGEQDELNKPARRNNTRQIKVIVSAPDLLTCHFPNLVKTQVQWAENEDELIEVGKFTIEESAAANLQFTVLANFFVREAMSGVARYRPLGLNHRVRLKSVTHSGPPQGPVLTNCEAKVYGW